jgi:hypothetical protein
MPGPGFDRSLFIVILVTIAIGIAIVLGSTMAKPGSGSGTGILTGNVTIGPLCPVEPCIIPPERLASAYSARTIIVSGTGGVVIAKAVPDPFIGYSFSLRPGTYTVDITHQGIDRSPDVPKTFTIRAGETVRLNISIDTGIR